MHWCFAIINGRLAEVFFDVKKNGSKRIFAHAYVRAEEFRLKREKEQIRKDTAKTRLSYRNKQYRRLVDGKSIALT